MEKRQTTAQPQNRKIRWGILGAARVANAVIVPGIQLSTNGTVLAVASRDPDRGRKFADKFGIPRLYRDYDELLADPDIDAVYVPLPNSLHKEWTIKTAERNKHVLCDKPLAANAQEAQEMVTACRKQGVMLMEGFAHRFHPHNVLVKKLIDEGKIGKVVGMTAVHSSGKPLADDIRLSRELVGGVLMDKGCYCVNTARFILQSEPRFVFAKIEFGRESRVDERVTCMLEFPGNAKVQFDTSYSLGPASYHQGYEVFGESGRIVVPSGFAQLATYRRNEIVDTTVTLIDEANKAEKVVVRGEHQWKLEVEYFADQIMNSGKISLPAEDGLSNMKVIDAIYQSAREGRAITL